MSELTNHDSAWEAILADPALKRARTKLSFHEIRLIVNHARKAETELREALKRAREVINALYVGMGIGEEGREANLARRGMTKRQEVSGRCAASRRRSAALRAEPASQSQAKPAAANARRGQCNWCGGSPVVTNLDGDDLCHPCANKWVRAEGAALAETQDGESD